MNVPIRGEVLRRKRRSLGFSTDVLRAFEQADERYRDNFRATLLALQMVERAPDEWFGGVK